MNRPFNTQDCAFCYVAKGVWTGCNPKRKAGADAKCAKCGSKLPPKGKIVKIKYVSIVDPMDDERQVASGYMARVKRDHDNEEEWYLIHCRGGQGSLLFPLLGSSPSELKEWLESEKLQATWPTDAMLGSSNTLVPFLNRTA